LTKPGPDFVKNAGKKAPWFFIRGRGKKMGRQKPGNIQYFALHHFFSEDFAKVFPGGMGLAFYFTGDFV
jgi:hypothetical protein